MPSLASAEELEARLGRDLTDAEAARVEALLADASALIRAYTRQQFDLVEDDVQVLRGQGGTIRLPQRPVTAVTAVVAVGGNSNLPDVPITDWVWDNLDLIHIGSGRCVINLPEVWWDDDGYPGTYRVTYSHGYPAVPADVVAVVCATISRVFNNPQGLRSESVGPYSVTYSVPATGEGLGLNLTRYDKEVLDKYRETVGQVQVRR